MPAAWSGMDSVSTFAILMRAGLAERDETEWIKDLMEGMFSVIKSLAKLM